LCCLNLDISASLQVMNMACKQRYRRDGNPSKGISDWYGMSCSGVRGHPLVYVGSTITKNKCFVEL